MEELAFRFRQAEADDARRLRALPRRTMARPDGQSRSESFKSAIERGELLLLERYGAREHTWSIAGFVDYHLRVDDALTIRDIGTIGDSVHTGIVRQLLNELLAAAAPVTASVKLRRDAEEWNAIFATTPGFELAGHEFRRPHWYSVWDWTRDRARRESGRPGRGGRRR
jgi:hypothetical protein